MRPTARRAAIAPLFFLYSVIVAGCAVDGTAPASSDRSTPQRYNLTGYSAGFKQGFGDACASPRRRDDARFKSEGDYALGWNDGSSMCKK
jgi:hypothetical protein